MVSVTDLVRSLPDTCDHCGRGVYAPRISGTTYSGTIDVSCDCSETLVRVDVDGGDVKPTGGHFENFADHLQDLQESFENVMTDDELAELEKDLEDARFTLDQWSGKPILIGNPHFFGVNMERQATVEKYLREGWIDYAMVTEPNTLELTLLKND